MSVKMSRKRKKVTSIDDLTGCGETLWCPVALA